MSQQQKRYAIIIGVSGYEDQLRELPLAKNDACRLQGALVGHCGFDADRVYLLAEGADTPTRSTVLQKIKYVCDTATEEDLVLLYFAGHGAEVSQKPYLMMSDTKMDVLKETAIKVEDVNDMLEASEARCILKVFDACRSPFGDGRASPGTMTERFQQAVMKCAAGWATFSSCSSGQMAYDFPEVNQGVFSYYLCEGLAGKAAGDDGVVSIGRLVDYVKTSVGNWCDRQTQRQTPHYQADLSGSLELATTKLPAKKEQIRPPDNPFASLAIGIDQYLSGVEDDARHLEFTSSEEWQEIAGMMFARLEANVSEFVHPAIDVELIGLQKLQTLGNPAWTQFNNDVSTSTLQHEYTGNVVGCRVRFRSSEPVIPAMSLTVALARFNFVYWLWYCNTCDSASLHKKFKPTPPTTYGVFCFKPSGARNEAKMAQALGEVARRVTDDFAAWSKQLGEYVGSRIAPLREGSELIE